MLSQTWLQEWEKWMKCREQLMGTLYGVFYSHSETLVKNFLPLPGQDHIQVKIAIAVSFIRCWWKAITKKEV